MAVFVDGIFTSVSSKPAANFVGTRTGHKWCHMWADTEEELHKMADKIGLKRSWFQNRERFPHYDLVPSKRRLALINGAIEKSLSSWIRDKGDSYWNPKTNKS